MGKLKFFVVEDNKSFLDGMILYLEQILKHEVIGYASDGLKFLNQRDKYIAADIILMDIHMPNMNGLLTTKRLLWNDHDKKVIAITSFQSEVGLGHLIYSGFKACVIKNRVFDDLPKAINAIREGKMFYPKEVRIVAGNP